MERLFSAIIDSIQDPFLVLLAMTIVLAIAVILRGVLEDEDDGSMLDYSAFLHEHKRQNKNSKKEKRDGN